MLVLQDCIDKLTEFKQTSLRPFFMSNILSEVVYV